LNLVQLIHSNLKIEVDEGFIERANEGEFVESLKEAREIQRQYYEENNGYPSSEDLISISENRITEEIAEYINKERTAIEKSEYKEWIVDDITGLAMVPINSRTTFSSMMITHDGKRVKGQKTVHPAITSSIALSQQESYFKKKYGNDYDKNFLLSRIRELLVLNQISECGKGIESEVNLWVEKAEARFQHRNTKFSIVESVANSFIKKIRNMGKDKITVVSIKENNSENVRRIVATVITEEAFSSNLLQANSL